MTIKRIYLHNFRNYEEAAVDFSPKVNLFVGDNAQGKSNLLEAICLLMTGRSFRTSHLPELIHFGASAFHLEALFEKNGVEQLLKFSFDGSERKVIHNATPLPSVSALLGILQGVVLSPEDNSLIKGGPQGRRHFLDLLLAQANPLYLHHLARYMRAMKQRNVLLKKKQLETLFVWEEQMALSAPFLTCRRAETTLALETLSQSETFSSEKISLHFRSSALHAVGPNEAALKNYYLKQFEKQRKRESELGVTLSGPHRDDLEICLQGQEARHFASEGQQRSCVATLKLAQWKWLQQLIDAPPTLCIDDIGISFDPKREAELYRRTEQLGQVFITTARTPNFSGHLIAIQGGRFIPAP